MLMLNPQIGVHMSDTKPLGNYMPVLDAAAATAKLLAEAGLGFLSGDEDLDAAAAVAREVARDPGPFKKKGMVSTIFQQTPAAVLMVQSILDEFGHRVVDEAQQIRDLVTNKLVIESDSDDPKQRMQALAMLGKISDVGLFNDRKEVVVTHKTTDEVRDKLRARLENMLASAVEAEEIEDEIEEEIEDEDE